MADNRKYGHPANPADQRSNVGLTMYQSKTSDKKRQSLPDDVSDWPNKRTAGPTAISGTPLSNRLQTLGVPEELLTEWRKWECTPKGGKSALQAMSVVFARQDEDNAARLRERQQAINPAYVEHITVKNRELEAKNHELNNKNRALVDWIRPLLAHANNSKMKGILERDGPEEEVQGWMDGEF